MTGQSTMAARALAVIILGIAVAVTAVGMVAATPKKPESSPAPPRPAPVAASTYKPIQVAVPSPAPTPATLVIRHVIDTGGPLRYGSYFWNDAAPATGPLTITVDVKASVLSVFRGGDEIGTAAVITGNDGKEAPLGTFPILSKARHHVSKQYHAPMPYTLRLTGDGVSIHASPVAADYATHGCIGLPSGFAAKLFAVAKVGDQVIITRRGMIAEADNKAAGRGA